MPIEKIAVVHKFGIISHSQRLELQDRLLKQSYARQKYGSQVPALLPQRFNLEVTEEFVQQFNAAEDQKEKIRLEQDANKFLQRIKRKTGLRSGGAGPHVDLPLAWTELSQLAQCKGKIQEECLDVLITSLDQAAICKSHIPALFFLAETTLYWLRTDAIHQPYLRTGEIKLLKMGQLVFTRLFYHHMAGQLKGHSDFKNRLFTYLDGFSDSQEIYNPYPNALLSIRYISEVGRMIVGDCNTEAGEIKEGDYQSNHGEAEHPQSDDAMTGLIETQSNHSGAISSSVHDLSPTLWHALDVWRCVRHLGGGQTEALTALLSCGQGLASESWVDGVCAMQIMADASKVNQHALKSFQSLARGISPPHFKEKSEKYASRQSGHSENDDTTEQASPLDFVTSKSPKTPTGTENKDSYLIDTVPNTAWKAEAGTDLPSGRASMTSSVPTYTNAPSGEWTGLNGWHWEVAITYVDCLADVCLHGNTSTIQKIALVGNNKDTSLVHRNLSEKSQPLPSAGLLDLVYFTAAHESHDGGSNDWSWRVRYAAIQGLVKLCRCIADAETKEGMRTVAWNTLIKAHSLEQDNRVLEALKVGQVDASIETLLSQNMTVSQSTIGARIAFGLAALYLPPLPPPVKTGLSSKSKGKERPKKALNQPMARPPLRTSLQDEIKLATALYEPATSHVERTGFDLKRIVEDQWRKELQEKQKCGLEE